MPEKYGKWNTLYRRFRRWTDGGVFDRIEKHLQSQAVSKKGVTVLALDSTYIKVHPDGAGTPKKRQQSIGKSRGGWTTKIHSVVADESMPLVRSLSAGSAGDSPEGQKLMEAIPLEICKGKPLLMDKAYDAAKRRESARCVRLFLRRVTGKNLDVIARSCIIAEMLLDATSVKSRSSGECSPDTTNGMKPITLLSQSQTSPFT